MTTNDTMLEQIAEMVAAGWSVHFIPDTHIISGIRLRKPGRDSIFSDHLGVWDTDLAASWAALYRRWQDYVEGVE